MRFLEIGHYALFARVWPAETKHFWTGRHPSDRIGDASVWWGPGRLRELKSALCHGDWSVAFCHAPDRHLRIQTGLALFAFRLVARYARDPLVLLDLNDEIPVVRQGLRLLDRATLYFKRELPIDRNRLLPSGARPEDRALLERNLGKIRPISIALGPWRIAPAPDPLPAKRTDLFFAGTVRNPNRKTGIQALKRLSQRGVRIDLVEGRIDREEYLRRTAEARLVWSPDGVGWDCFRHYEAGAMGSVPVMPWPWIEPFHPFRDAETALYYDPDGDDLERVVTSALRDPDRLVRMGEAARRHVLAHHMHERVTSHILEEAAKLSPLKIPSVITDRGAVTRNMFHPKEKAD